VILVTLTTRTAQALRLPGVRRATSSAGRPCQEPDYELAERTLTFGPGVTSQSRPCVTLPMANSGVF